VWIWTTKPRGRRVGGVIFLIDSGHVKRSTILENAWCIDGEVGVWTVAGGGDYQYFSAEILDLSLFAPIKSTLLSSITIVQAIAFEIAVDH
jgi:hypothetical protein